MLPKDPLGVGIRPGCVEPGPVTVLVLCLKAMGSSWKPWGLIVEGTRVVRLAKGFKYAAPAPEGWRVHTDQMAPPRALF